MKKSALLFILFALSSTLYSQNIRYSLHINPSLEIIKADNNYNDAGFWSQTYPAYPEDIKFVQTNYYGGRSIFVNGFSINGNVSFPIRKYFDIQTGLGIYSHELLLSINPLFTIEENMYEPKYWTYYSINSEDLIQYWGIAIPIMFNKSVFKERLFISAGPVFSHIIGSYVDEYFLFQNIEGSILFDGLRKNLLSFKAGIDLKIYRKLYIGLNFKRSLSKFINNYTIKYYEKEIPIDDNENKIFLRSFGAELSYRF